MFSISIGLQSGLDTHGLHVLGIVLSVVVTNLFEHLVDASLV